MSGEPDSPHRWPPRLRAVVVVAFVIGSVLVLCGQAMHEPIMVVGDGWEYWYQAESFHRHFSPELLPSDVAAINDAAASLGIGPAPEDPYAYVTAPDGRLFSQHFWAYGLSAVPAKMCLPWFGINELTCLQVTNALWMILAIGVTLFASRAPVGERLALAGLATVGPVLHYVNWQGAEMFSWSLGLMGVVAFREGRYGWAGLASGLAATQNPPAVFLGAAAVLAATWQGRWRTAVWAFAGTAISLIPFAFVQYHFGRPSLIVGGVEYAGISNLSWVRTWGFLTDFNHGLLPYAPMLVIGLVIATVRLVWKRNARGLFLVLGGVGMMIGTEVAHNWNSGCDGLQRYLVWMIPVAAGVVVEGAGSVRRLLAFAAVAVLVHSLIIYELRRTHALWGGHLAHTPLAGWVLNEVPELYWIEPEVFVERCERYDGWPHVPTSFPVTFVRDDGTVSKMLLDAASVDELAARYEVDPAYLSVIRERVSGVRGPFFANPPRGTVRVRPEAKRE